MKKWLLPVTVLLVLFFSQKIDAQDAGDDLYSTTKVHDLRINFTQPNWAELLDSLRNYGEGMILANIVVDGTSYADVGVRYRGRKSFKAGLDHNPFHLKLDYIRKSQNHQGYKEIKLSNALRDPSMVREVMSYEIARQYMPAPKAGYVSLTINNKYHGFYVNVEAVDDVFLTRHFGSSDNSFFKCSPPKDGKANRGCKKNVYSSLEYEESAACYLGNYEKKSKQGWDDLIELTRVLNQDPDKVGNVLHVDRVLWMLAFNNVLVNLNSYSGGNSENYYLYQDEQGRFNPIVWDLNLSFGSYKNIGQGSDLNLKALQRISPLLHADNVTKPLIYRLLADEDYKKVYLSHIRTIIYDHFVDGEYQKRAEELQQLIRLSLYYPNNRKFEGNDYTEEEFNKSLKTTIGKRSKIPGIVELMSERARFLKKHPSISIIPPTVQEVTVLKREKFSNETVRTFKIQAKVDKLPKRVKLYYRFSGEDLFQTVYMADDGQNNDGEAGDKVFGITIDPNGKSDSIEYFILAENASAASFDPPNYMHQPYSSSLKDLN